MKQVVELRNDGFEVQEHRADTRAFRIEHDNEFDQELEDMLKINLIRKRMSQQKRAFRKGE